MVATPRIRRANPGPGITRPDESIPVIAGLRWHDGTDWGDPQPTEGFALAWSATAVQVRWIHDGEIQTDWLDPADVKSRR